MGKGWKENGGVGGGGGQAGGEILSAATHGRKRPSIEPQETST